jgi:hydrogenase small subunit
MTDKDKQETTVADALRANGISRRSFLKFCAATASLMALPPTAATAIASALEAARRPSVIWLSFQECTGCTESLTRSHAPSIEGLIFDAISLDYHHTLQAASGDGAEDARLTAMKENHGKYIVVVDGSIPLKDEGIYSTIAGMTNLEMLNGKRHNQRQADYQCSRVPAYPRGYFRCTGPVPDFRTTRTGPPWKAKSILWTVHP